MDDLLRQQWDSLMGWLRAAHVEAHYERPTGLGVWTVADLVAHLGLGLGLASNLQGTGDDQTALRVGEYVSAYRPAAAEIDELTQRTRAALGANPMEGLDDIAQHVWLAIANCDQEYLQARRGPIRRDDYLVTRLIELVVHADDLWRVLDGATTPVLPEALTVVSSALVDAYYEKTGVHLNVGDRFEDQLDWVRSACGRQPSDDAALPLL